MRTTILLLLMTIIGSNFGFADEKSRTDHAIAVVVQKHRFTVMMSEDSIARQFSLDKLFELTTLNNRDAFNALGIIFLKGKGVPKDSLKAFEMFKSAADLGLKDAMCNLAKMYREGKGGIDRNYLESFRYYQIAAELGHHLAIYGLARCYFNGHGVKRDIHQAYLLYERAYDYNIIAAKYRVGTCLYRGKGVSQNKEMGLRLVNEVYKDGFTQAKKFYINNNLPIPSAH
ncbi:tetratricopeptide repeat protein [Prolixibacteraceae bacterium]|nr:tetratricopeptide repeat protein [Prolixibacteraceae bacterium]